jgi:DNA helicase TIP49 (TBP-interacting protein)
METSELCKGDVVKVDGVTGKVTRIGWVGGPIRYKRAVTVVLDQTYTNDDRRRSNHPNGA